LKTKEKSLKTFLLSKYHSEKIEIEVIWIFLIFLTKKFPQYFWKNKSPKFQEKNRGENFFLKNYALEIFFHQASGFKFEWRKISNEFWDGNWVVQKDFRFQIWKGKNYKLWISSFSFTFLSKRSKSHYKTQRVCMINSRNRVKLIFGGLIWFNFSRNRIWWFSLDLPTMERFLDVWKSCWILNHGALF